MANPPNLQYCKITGNFKAFIADNADDDDLPDFVPMSGSGQIWPNVTLTKNTQTGFKSTYFNSPISITVDLDGDLSQGDRKYVMVLAGSENLNPSSFNYSILLNLSAQGESASRAYGPFAFDIIPGGEIDITDVIPVTANAGVPIVQGPRGEAGDMSKVVGPMPVTGVVTLTEEFLPSTQLWTLLGNTTVVLPTPSAALSGTITLIMTQDGTGNRVITWPSEVKWTEGIEPQPSTTANTVSMFHLLWTGAEWFGMNGGRNFA